MNKNILIICGLAAVVMASVIVVDSASQKNMYKQSIVGQNDKVKVTLYKSPTCGCCVKYVSYLEERGFDVQTIAMRDMAAIKVKYNIPRQMESCHTVVIGDYFIEGHVPFKAINKLLQDKPVIDGISLPNMPAGTPGMPGAKQEEWIIYSLVDGKYFNYLTI